MSGKVRNLAAALLLAIVVCFASAQDGGQAGPNAPATTPPPATELPAPRNLYLPHEAASAVPSLAPAVPEENTRGDAMPPVAAVPAAPPSASDGCSAPPGNFRQRWHYHTQSVFWGFPSQFQRPPLGYFLRAHGETEVANGTAVRMTLYHYDFVDGSGALNLHGRDQLAKIAAMLPHNFFPIVIERTPGAPGLAESRRLAVLHELAAGPFPIPAERVVIGPSLGDDLRGVEAEIMNFNIMAQDQARGIGSVQGGGFVPFGSRGSSGAGAGAGAGAPGASGLGAGLIGR